MGIIGKFLVQYRALVAIFVALGVALLLAVAWVGRKELRKIGKRLPKIGEILWSIWCFLFIIRWKFQFALRKIFVSSTLGVLALASLYLFTEVALTLVHGVGVEWQRTAAWYAFVFTKDLPKLPLWLDGLLLLFALVMFRHHLRESKVSREEWELSPALEKMLVKLDEFPPPSRTLAETRSSRF